MIDEKKCVICGWNKKVEAHHLKKYVDWGLNAAINIVYLCPNHHWLADFGNEEDRKLLLLKIKELTGKEPIEDITKKEYFDKLLRCKFEEQFGKMNEEQWKEFQNSWNYEFAQKIINSRPSAPEWNEKLRFIQELEKKYLIAKLKIN